MTDIIMQTGALDALPALCQNSTPLIICDDNTFEVAGKTVKSMLPSAQEIVTLGKRPVPSVAMCHKLIEQHSNTDLLIAVGSGSINDIVKYTAHKHGCPYICVATAPSMNGYLSPTASLKDGEHKHSFPATPPIALIAELSILNSAPLKLIKAGIGDLLCRSTIQADMILSHYLLGTEYKASWFEPLREKETTLRHYEDSLHQRDPVLVETLMEALLIGGKMMQTHNSSAPCSQGEHMIIHTFETLYGMPKTILHGEAISVATVSMAKLQKKLMKRRPKIRPLDGHSKDIKRIFKHRLGDEAEERFLRKQLNQERCDALNDQMETLWPTICEEIERQTMAVHHLQMSLKKFYCPVSFRDLHWSKDRYENAITKAYLTRDRFTFLDLAAMDKTLRYEI